MLQNCEYCEERIDFHLSIEKFEIFENYLDSSLTAQRLNKFKIKSTFNENKKKPCR